MKILMIIIYVIFVLIARHLFKICGYYLYIEEMVLCITPIVNIIVSCILVFLIITSKIYFDKITNKFLESDNNED